MQVNVLSVRAPFSQLICLGLKDIENRSWSTGYRGRLYIHSSGKTIKWQWLDLTELPLDWYNESDKLDDGELSLEDSKYFEKFENNKFYTYEKYKKNDYIIRQRKLYGLCFDKQEENKPFYLGGAIIGHVDLVDVVTHSNSRWADDDSNFYWKIENAVFYKNPIMDVKGQLKLWKYDLDENVEREAVTFEWK